MRRSICSVVGWAAPAKDLCRRRMLVGGAHRARAFTLVEMLVAMAITLVMMAAVVTLFANVTGSVRNRRATAEMSGQMRHVRNVLQQDLQGATCPGLTWQRPESNHGYIEIIEGQYRDYFPSMLTDGNLDSDQNGNPDLDGDGIGDIDEIRPEESIIPGANDGSLVQPDPTDSTKPPISTVSGLGDYDDILMLTVRNEHEPFVGRVPELSTNDQQSSTVRPNPTTATSFDRWTSYDTMESTLAEVVWFAVENPLDSEDQTNFFGEPGIRTIYRRTLLIAPWLNPYRYVAPNGAVTDTFRLGGDDFKAEPGLLRLLDVTSDDVAGAIAAVIAFQDRYDLSVRLEWDHNIQRWKIMANTLGDLTKRENRFGHFGYFHGSGGTNPPRQIFPRAFVSWGSGYKGDRVVAVGDADIGGPGTSAQITAYLDANDSVVSYSIDQPGNGYPVRPFVFLQEDCSVPATANAMLDDQGRIVRVVHGPAPLWGARRGQDVMLTSALAFDLRVYDPGAPLFGLREIPGDTTSPISVVISPSDAGYTAAYIHGDNSADSGIGTGALAFPLTGQGAYVDLGYCWSWQLRAMLNTPRFASASATDPWFFAPPLEVAASRARNTPVTHGGALADVYGNQLAPGYAVYDTWSFHYENNGVDEDADGSVDEGTDGLDSQGNYLSSTPPPPLQPPYTVEDIRFGVDDAGERETAPPYDKPLRGIQVLLRAYEPDSRAIRQVRVNQHFMPE